MKKRIALTMASLLTFSSVACFAATKTPVTSKSTNNKAVTTAPAAKPPVVTDTGKKISAYFYNIKVSINGQTLNSPLEPFIYNDNVYVPLRSIVEGMGGVPTWDGNTKSITVQNNTATELTELKGKTMGTDFQLNSLQAQVKSKDDKIKDLESQISDLEKKVKDLKNDSSSSSYSTSDLRKDLENRKDVYGSGSDKMRFTYEVDKANSSRIDVIMKGDFSKSENVWKNRGTSDFRSFVKEVCQRINDNREFRDYDVKVYVKDKNSDNVLRCDYTYRNSSCDYTDYN